MDPARGGKLVSLRDRRTGREWLMPPAHPTGESAGYGAEFVGAELCGWDEMVPTIVACTVTTSSGSVALPDHGEIWSVPWTVIGSDAHSVTAAVTGTAMDYRFERTIRLLGEEEFRLTYRLETEVDDPLPVLWAAHPQLRWLPGSRVVLPPEVATVLEVTATPPREVPWNDALARLLDHAEDGTGHKVWCLPDVRPASAALVDADGGSLRMSWNPLEVPYLGVWFDAGAHAAERVVALEPSTGFYDDLAVAVGRGLAGTVARGAPLEWHLDLHVIPAYTP